MQRTQKATRFCAHSRKRSNNSTKHSAFGAADSGDMFNKTGSKLNGT
jgi:hypothetical protein